MLRRRRRGSEWCSAPAAGLHLQQQGGEDEPGGELGRVAVAGDLSQSEDDVFVDDVAERLAGSEQRVAVRSPTRPARSSRAGRRVSEGWAIVPRTGRHRRPPAAPSRVSSFAGPIRVFTDRSASSTVSRSSMTAVSRPGRSRHQGQAGYTARRCSKGRGTGRQRIRGTRVVAEVILEVGDAEAAAAPRASWPAGS